jgi:hypothetical protein
MCKLQSEATYDQMFTLRMILSAVDTIQVPQKSPTKEPY